MILLEKTEVSGWEAAIRGMRNPMNSWKKSDSQFHEDGDCHDICGNMGPSYADESGAEIGPNDLDLMMRLAQGGSVHAKYRRMITVTVDITAPLYWWKEFDTYKVGTVANSCSTMHKIHAKEFTEDDFSIEHLVHEESRLPMKAVIDALNYFRDRYLEVNEEYIRKNYPPTELDPIPITVEEMKKECWWQMIQLLPSSYNQKRTVLMNYEVLTHIYPDRKNHKLDEWHEFCHWIEELPYSELIIGKKEELTYEDLFRKFQEQNPLIHVMDYRPYPLCPLGLLIWVDGVLDKELVQVAELVFQYDTEKDIFTRIPDAKRYDEVVLFPNS